MYLVAAPVEPWQAQAGHWRRASGLQHVSNFREGEPFRQVLHALLQAETGVAKGQCLCSCLGAGAPRGQRRPLWAGRQRCAALQLPDCRVAHSAAGLRGIARAGVGAGGGRGKRRPSCHSSAAVAKGHAPRGGQGVAGQARVGVAVGSAAGCALLHCQRGVLSSGQAAQGAHRGISVASKGGSRHCAVEWQRVERCSSRGA